MEHNQNTTTRVQRNTHGKINLTEVEIIAGGKEENERVALCRYQGHEGIVDNEGNVIVPFRYSSINGYVWDASGRLAVINDEGLLGHVDIHGNEVIPCRFPPEVLEDAPFFCFCEDRFPIVDQNGLIGFIDPMGEVVIPGRFRRVRHFRNGVCAVLDENNKWRYIDKDGNMLMRQPSEETHNGDSSVLARMLAKIKNLFAD